VFGEKVPVPLAAHIPEPVDETPVKDMVELFAQTVGLAPGVTVPGCETKTEIVLVCPGHPATVANTE
jgi:hypothetical protein